MQSPAVSVLRNGYENFSFKFLISWSLCPFTSVSSRANCSGRVSKTLSAMERFNFNSKFKDNEHQQWAIPLFHRFSTKRETVRGTGSDLRFQMVRKLLQVLPVRWSNSSKAWRRNPGPDYSFYLNLTNYGICTHLEMRRCNLWMFSLTLSLAVT